VRENHLIFANNSAIQHHSCQRYSFIIVISHIGNDGSRFIIIIFLFFGLYYSFSFRLSEICLQILSKQQAVDLVKYYPGLQLVY
jgi:hypothetical protein